MQRTYKFYYTFNRRSFILPWFNFVVNLYSESFLLSKPHQLYRIFPWAVSFSKYSAIGLYTSSTIYHGKIAPIEKLEFLRKIDHIMIYVLIASSYTPMCLITLKGFLGYLLLGIVWSLALVGIILKIFWMNAPRWLSTGFYLLLGWIAIFFIYPISKVLPTFAIALLVLGGIMYSVGAIIYGKKSEKCKIGKFGFHEIFHVFILLGSFFHFVMIYRYVIV